MLYFPFFNNRFIDIDEKKAVRKEPLLFELLFVFAFCVGTVNQKGCACDQQD